MPPPPSSSHGIRDRWLAGAVFCALTLMPTLARAEETIFHLRNGDRITGAIVNDAGVEITIQTSFAGRISIPASQIERREVVPAKAVTTPNAAANAAQSPVAQLPSNTPPPIPGSAPGLSTNEPPTAPSTPPATAPIKPKPSPTRAAMTDFFKNWHGEAQVGVNVGFSTRDHQTYTARMRALYSPKAVVRNTFDYLASYGQTEGITSENQMDGSWKIEHDIGSTKRFLVYNAVGGGYNEIQKVDLRYDLGPGVGYKWLSLTNYSLRTEFGGNFQQQYYQNDTDKTRYSLRLAESMLWQLTKRLRFDNQFEFFPEMENLGDFRIRAEGNLSYAVRDNLTFTLGVIDLYDTAPAPGATKNDLQLRSVIGLRF